MNVHLIKSAEVDEELFVKVVHFLQSIPGPIAFLYEESIVAEFEADEVFGYFIRDRDHFDKKMMAFNMESASLRFPFERETATWNVLFEKAARYRKKKNIPNDDFVILLTEIANKENWFAALDENMPYNGFIHTADWEYYIKGPDAFPVAYEVIALILQKHMFEGMREVREHVHQVPIGCVSDFCANKRDIILKLRTGDICEECIERLTGKLSVPVLHHALQIMGSLREKMLFAQNLKRFSPVSKLLIDHKYRFILTDFENMEIKLRPLEKAMYLLFLRYPDGIFHSSLSEHREELYQIYTALSNKGDLREMKIRIDDMVNALSDSASQKISRIKRVFEDAIGPDLASHYYIKGEVGQKKKIDLNRELVIHV